MSQFRLWAMWRRLQYGLGFSIFLSLIGVVIYFTNFYTPPSCFDNIQNGKENGVDCDGKCVRICSVSALAPKIVWAESFEITDGQYNAVAYVENMNPTASTKQLKYTFRLLDQGTTVAERSGVTILPPNSVYPIFEGRIMTDNARKPNKTELEIEPIEVWQPATLGRNQFTVRDFNLTSADSRPRLTTHIENLELTGADAVEVVATIFNSAGKPLTSSQTFVDDFAPRSTREVVFTWPNSIAKTVRTCEVPSDIMVVLDRSGSMAADGGNPPEPLQSAKAAAASFVNQLEKNSQIGFVSYATAPTSPIEQLLTSDTKTVTDTITNVKMGSGEIQYTNMGDAFKVATEELKSSRHREDARKVIVFMTDGDVTRPVNPETGELDRAYAADYARQMATQAKDDDITIYTIGFGKLNTSSDGLVRDSSLIKELATAPEYYFEAPTIAELKKVYQDIAKGICEDGPARIEVLTKTATNFTPLR